MNVPTLYLMRPVTSHLTVHVATAMIGMLMTISSILDIYQSHIFICALAYDASENGKSRLHLL